MAAVKTRLGSKAADFFDKGIFKLFLDDKRLNSGGDYSHK
jgi:hypothetical protein